MGCHMLMAHWSFGRHIRKSNPTSPCHLQTSNCNKFLIQTRIEVPFAPLEDYDELFYLTLVSLQSNKFDVWAFHEHSLITECFWSHLDQFTTWMPFFLSWPNSTLTHQFPIKEKPTKSSNEKCERSSNQSFKSSSAQ